MLSRALLVHESKTGVRNSMRTCAAGHWRNHERSNSNKFNQKLEQEERELTVELLSPEFEITPVWRKRLYAEL